RTSPSRRCTWARPSCSRSARLSRSWSSLFRARSPSRASLDRPRRSRLVLSQDCEISTGRRRGHSQSSSASPSGLRRANAMKLVTWSLATFHATTFVLAIVLFAYSGGGLGGALSGLNTFVGLGLFVALWATTYFTTSKALAGLDLIGSARYREG